MPSLVWLLAGGLLTGSPVRQPAVAPGQSPEETERVPAAPKPSLDHERLDVLAGTWRFERTTSLPGRPTERTSGISENRWILGNHYLECRAREGAGTAAGESLMTYGFDIRRRVYFSLFIASRGMNYQNLEGFYDEPTRSFVLIGRDAGDGSRPGPKLRQVVRVESRDRYVVEMFIVVPGQPAYKATVITYARE